MVNVVLLEKSFNEDALRILGKRGHKMNENNNLLKKAYALLSVSAVISGILLIVAIGIGIYYTVVGLGDSNGGGWLLFIVLIFVVIFFPSILGGVLQILFYLMGTKAYKIENTERAKTYGMISAIAGMAGNAYFAFFFLNKETYQKYQSIDVFLIIVAVTFIIYGAIIVGILIKAKNKDNSNGEK